MEAIQRLLHPRSIAVVGASSDESKMTGRPVLYLQKHGFDGAIYPVNPRLSQIAGLTCYPNAAALPEAPDAAIVLLDPQRAVQVVRDLAERGTAAAIVLASGFAETGEEGARRQAALKMAAGTMRLLGPNTIGLVNLTDRITLSATAALEIANLPKGTISIVSQSGGILGSLLSRAADRGIGLAKLVATGNEVDLDSTDLLDVLVEDEATSVLAVYLEGLRQPDKFRRVAARAAQLGKPIVVFKVGRSSVGAQAAVSHTGALAGEDRIYDAMFRQLGVIRAERFSDLLDIPAALAAGRRAAGRRVAILTSTGGVGTLIADDCASAGFDFPPPDAKTVATLTPLLDDKASAQRNPLDITLAGLRPAIFTAAIDALLASPVYDSLLVVIGSSALANPEIVADALRECRGRSDKPLLAYISPHAPEVMRLLNGSGIPAFAAPESFAPVLEALQAQARSSTSAADRPPLKSRPAFAEGWSGVLNEAESKALFAHFGVRGVREEIATTGEEAGRIAQKLGGPVVLKILARNVPHKSDFGGVKLGLTAEETPAACEIMLGSLAANGVTEVEGFLVQEQVSGGVELILGLRRDPHLGAFVLLGMGGVTAELLGDVAIRLLPVTRDDADAMIDELKLSPLLKGYRGAQVRDLNALADAIVAFAAMGEVIGTRLSEAEINPLFVMAEGQGVRAADGLAVLQ